MNKNQMMTWRQWKEIRDLYSPNVPKATSPLTDGHVEWLFSDSWLPRQKVLLRWKSCVEERQKIRWRSETTKTVFHPVFRIGVRYLWKLTAIFNQNTSFFVATNLITLFNCFPRILSHFKKFYFPSFLPS